MRLRTLHSTVLMIAAALVAADRQLPMRRRCATNGARTSSIRFFVGGAEGDAFGTIVYNGAKQAAADTGPKSTTSSPAGTSRRWCSSCARPSP